MAVGLLGISAFSALAESSVWLRVQIPFAFVAGQANLPAGDYIVTEDSTSGVVMLQSQATKSAAVVLSSNGNTPLHGRSPELIFERRGDRNVLTQVQVSDSPSRIVPVALNNLGAR
jgi:hypothetical protein